MRLLINFNIFVAFLVFIYLLSMGNEVSASGGKDFGEEALMIITKEVSSPSSGLFFFFRKLS